MNKLIKNTSTLLLSVCLITACQTVEKKATLRDIDRTGSEQQGSTGTFIKPKSEEEIRRAYNNYLSNTDKNDKSRQNAINRLAELEFEVSNKLEQENSSNDIKDEIREQLYNKKLNKAIELFKTSLTDYPKAKGNDNVLYQLAKAYDQKGDYNNSINTLYQLIKQYPKSTYYTEAQFRLAEAYFSQSRYTEAEDAYTEVIISRKNLIFYEKAVFKRGWARFKQSFYEHAVDDYLQAVTYHNFDDIEKLNQSEKELFEEYFRAIGLSFSNLGGAEALHNFFQDKADFKYLYYTYSVVSNIYLKQERYTDAAETLNQFIQRYPNSQDIPHAQLKIVNVWQKSNFTEKLYQAVEDFYVSYNTHSQYWKKNKNNKTKKTIDKSMKKYVLLMSEYFHSEYQKKAKAKNYQSAQKWYQRYLQDYASYARQDKIYYRYAELLSEKKHYEKALSYYELAAYDGELILDKKSAYATIVLSNKLYESQSGANKKELLSKHLKYALLFAQLYTKDKRTENIILNASKMASTTQQYETTIELINILGDKISNKNIYSTNVLKAQAHYNLEQFQDAENLYSTILTFKQLKIKDRKIIQDRLALSIYKQAVTAKNSNNVLDAGNHYTRISDVAKTSKIAATGMYDAIALYMNNQLWNQAVVTIKRFQMLYPKHQFNRDVTKKLSVAYLNSNQNIKAAEQFEKISAFEKDKNVKMTALWQAAELYESNKNYTSAIRSYSEYANNYKKPYSQYMEAMQKLVVLYTNQNKTKLKSIWQKRIVKADKKAKRQDKTERTKYIAAVTTLSLAKDKYTAFQRRKLVEPLKSNLRKKKKLMQEAIKLYGQASAFGIIETTTESTYSIAQIYQKFSQSLLNSERPKSLKGDELEQYNILLEDQAFPFEDKAIEFYEINLSRIKNNVYDNWIEKSLTELKKSFPVKYDRKNKIDGYINAIH
ncbi:tetratricopeptide repeat protein [Aliikangiella sp. IMCC44359]|uniref:tetratricopeptide repeat protein n=1 Tax=Aliikangiella sp. IMCC44359 TaxID=3459125 RepID=UPI00403B078D